MSLVATGYQVGSGNEEELEGQQEINILVLLPSEIPDSFQQPFFRDGPILRPVIELAVEQINQQKDMLPGYNISIFFENSACNLKSNTAINFVKSFFYSGLSFVGIVGPACSDATKLVAPITGESRISILNFHIGNSPVLADRIKYGYSFGTTGSTHGFVGLLLHLMKENDWQSVAVFFEESKTVFLTSYSLLVDELPQVFPQGRIVYSEPISDTYLPLSSISDHHVRIILVIATPNLISRMLCLISKVYPKLTFPTYQFVLFGATKSRLQKSANFKYQDHHYFCSVHEITHAMEGFLLNDFNMAPHDSDNSTILVSGITYEKYVEQLQSVVNGSLSEYTNPVYDSVWSLALALNNSIPNLDDIGLSLSDYKYGNQNATNIIRDEVLKLKFTGASGNISYDNETGFRKATVEFFQLINNDSILIGYYSEETTELQVVGSGEFIESTFESEELLVHPALASLFLFIAFIALLLIIISHFLTLTYHKSTSIRASSYRLSQLTFTGCYLLTISIVTFTVQKVAPTSTVSFISLCAIQAWFVPLGFTMILGTVTAKTWRLYRIFIHLRKPGKLLADWVLIIGVLALASVDVILCTVWIKVSPFSAQQDERITEANKIEVRVQCQSKHYLVWLGSLTAYNGLIMIAALTLAILTKSIRHKSFKTKAVTLLVYLLTATILIGLPIYFILSATGVSGVNAEYAVLSLTFNIVLYLCFGLLFLPPIIPLLREKLFHRIPALQTIPKSKTESYNLSSFSSKN